MQVVRCPLALLEQGDGASRQTIGPLAGDQRRRDLQPSVGEIPDPFHTLHLARVVADQAPQTGHRARQDTAGELVGFEVVVLAGQQVATCAGFGLEGQRADLGHLVLDLDGVEDPALRLPVLRHGHAEQHRGHHKGHKRDGHHHAAPGSKGEVRPSVTECSVSALRLLLGVAPDGHGALAFPCSGAASPGRRGGGRAAAVAGAA